MKELTTYITEQNQILLESQLDLIFESLGDTYDGKKEWDETKDILNDLIQNGVIKVSKGIVNTTIDVTKLIGKLTKLFIECSKHLIKMFQKSEAGQKIKQLLKDFKSKIKEAIKSKSHISPKQVLYIFLISASLVGVTYTTYNYNNIKQEVASLINLKYEQNTKYAVGLDLSHHQQYFDIDWQTLGQNMDYVILRCQDGINTKDKKFKEYWDNAKGVGLKTGMYFFFRPGQDINKQVDIFINHIKSVEGVDIIPMVDLENACFDDWKFKGSLSKKKEEYKNRILQFFDIFEQKAGYYPGVYAGAKHLTDYNLDELYKADGKYNVPIFAAHYDNSYKNSMDVEDDLNARINSIYNKFDSRFSKISNNTYMLQYTKMGTPDGIKIPKGAKEKIDLSVCRDLSKFAMK